MEYASIGVSRLATKVPAFKTPPPTKNPTPRDHKKLDLVLPEKSLLRGKKGGRRGDAGRGG